mmetsp:Transcript_2198/g.6087  ORF Transcript_2198/g.6087 Transcript_2198/m.6087 type:complete len:298 (-) Transcript_2198:701-1594(-)
MRHSIFLWVTVLFSAATSVTGCTPYLLHNECSSILETVFVREESGKMGGGGSGNETLMLPTLLQEDIFNRTIAWAISDIRMLPDAECRRGGVSLLCASAFPDCVVDNEGLSRLTLPCRSECERITTGACGDALGEAGINCSVLALSEDPADCSIISQEIALPVITCLPDGVDCCIDDIIMSASTGECVLDCPIVFFSKSKDRAIFVISGIFTWISVMACIISVPPFAMDGVYRRFPNNLPLCLVLAATAQALMGTWAIYVGATDFCCPAPGTSLPVNTSEFLTSSTAIAQAVSRPSG